MIEIKATDKQIDFALSLLRQNGWPTDNMDTSFHGLGASNKDCLGRVEPWLRGMSRSQISELIDRLKEG